MRSFLFHLFFLVCCGSLSAQTASYSFRRVTTNDGLSDGVVNCITQDKFGYIWFGTQSGLNRFNGYNIANFTFNRKDSFSAPPDLVRTILCDREGTLWMGYSNGLYEFDYTSQHFVLLPATKGIPVNEIKQGEGDNIFLFTEKGLAQLHTKSKQFSFCKTGNNKGLLQLPMFEGCVYRQMVYVAADTGIIAYNNAENSTTVLNVVADKKTPIRRITTDTSGGIWAYGYDKGPFLYKGLNGNTSFEVITSLQYNSRGGYDNIMEMYTDEKNRLWIATIWKGLVLFNTKDNSYTTIVNDSRMTTSLPENHLTDIFLDKKGFIWLGTEGSGAAYFNPDYNLFKIYFPESLKNIRPHIWCRAIAEDKDGNLWAGTGLGLVKQKPGAKEYTLFERNESDGKLTLHNNSIRSLLCDDDNNVWIGTAGGVNMYESSTGKMKFFGEKDSLPESFYWSIYQDSENTIWYGCNKGLFYKLPGDSKFYSINQHAVLKPYAGMGVRSIFEDSRGNLWIGLNGKGLLLYDRVNYKAVYWNDPVLPGNLQGRIITSITEDKKNIIWFSSYYGISSYDYKTDKFNLYADISVMESLEISCLAVDDANRLWLASSKGLLMLDKERKNFKRFGTTDGLPDIQFNEQTAYKLRSGEFVYPTYDGFVFFNPLQYREKNSSYNTMVSRFSAGGKTFFAGVESKEQKEVWLGSTQNFFNIELTAFNYFNPDETWYSYKLEGFDKDRIYTKDRRATYTNVPGGDYIFYYKASSDPNNWNVEEKTLVIHVATIFYKTWWFLSLVGLGLISIIVFVYRYRIAQKEKLLQLENKAKLLEKEKTQVLYENLKQQLNPHFLFNSLTSLGSLISINPKTAGEFLDSLSKTYRYILKSNDSETVPLINELKFASSYIKLQQTRFGNGLQVNVDVPEEYNHRLIVPVTLQNMIENAIKHNIIDDESPLVIDIYVEDDYIVVRNNLQKKSIVETSNKRGLANLLSLYRYLTDKLVEINEDKNHFTIKIPLL